jgi:enamine deaminase RidA (YjgF/YER057c/UK114 family)
MMWHLVNKSDYLRNLSAIGQAWRDKMGRNFPAMAAVQVVALMEDRAKIEIQAHAVLPLWRPPSFAVW